MSSREHLLRAKNVSIERVKILVPEILVEMKSYLGTDLGDTKKFDYKRIKKFYKEERGDLDSCGGHYQLQTRTDYPIVLGRISFSYRDKSYDDSGNTFAGVFDVYVTNQGEGDEETVDEITEKIKSLLDKEKVEYENRF